VTRRKLLERLATTTLDVAALVAARLDDDRWYVQRNMLLLLARMGRVPDRFPLARWTTHPDERLRSEALRLQMALPGQRELALRAGVGMPIVEELYGVLFEDRRPASALQRLMLRPLTAEHPDGVG